MQSARAAATAAGAAARSALALATSAACCCSPRCRSLLLWSNPYWVNILAYTYLFAALAAAWNIIGGFGGQFSLGHGVFFAIGAYSVARLYLDLGVTPWLGDLPGRGARDRRGAADLLADLPAARAVLRHRHDGDQRGVLRARQLQRRASPAARAES